MSWKIDSAHSQISFTVRHMMISNVHGRFEDFTGNVDFDENVPADSKVYVEINAASISTRDPQRDTHLKSPDFLDVEKYPKIIFKSTNVEELDKNHAHLHGDLTIKDVTKPVVLDVEYAGQSKSPWGGYSAGFTATTKINRKDWGLEWNVALETGGWLVGDIITINMDMEIIKQTEAAEETTK